MTETPSETWMQAALEEARRASDLEEVPVGAVAVVGEEIVARAHNLRESTQNPLGHAEILLLQKLTSSPSTGGRGEGEGAPTWRLTDVTIVVTLEPCVMCMGALLQARVGHLIYGCKDPKAGACGSVYDLVGDRKLPHRIEVVSGICAEECSHQLTNFFSEIRKKIKTT